MILKQLLLGLVIMCILTGCYKKVQTQAVEKSAVATSTPTQKGTTKTKRQKTKPAYHQTQSASLSLKEVLKHIDGSPDKVEENAFRDQIERKKRAALGCSLEGKLYDLNLFSARKTAESVVSNAKLIRTDG